MKKLLIVWAISTGALLLLPVVFGDRVRVDNWKTAMFASVIIGLINMSIGAIIRFITLPFQILTLGVLTLLINGLLLYWAAKVSPGFVIDGYWWAFAAAIVYSLITWAGAQLLLGGRRS